jgi:ligand-binding sensor protein
MKLTDIQPAEKWIELEKKIHEKSGFNASVFNTDGYRITEFKKWANRLCPVIKANDKGQSFICAVAHMNLATQAMKTKDHVIEECDAGLVKLVVPVFFKDEFIGAVSGCGLLMDGGEVDAFMINKTIDMDEAEAKSLSDDIKKVSLEFLESIAGFIKEEIKTIMTDFEIKYFNNKNTAN